MKFALYGLHRGSSIDPGTLTQRARAAEAAGFESLWVGDHVAVPAGIADDDDRLEALVALGFLAAATTEVLLGVGVLVLPQRQPVLLAKQLTSIDQLSDGRLIVGIGAGWNETELAAFGVATSERGARTDEGLRALLALWRSDPEPFDGKWTRFAGVVERPQPRQHPHPPIVIGGHVDAALRRAAAHGDGWFGWELDVDAAGAFVERLREAERTHRDAGRAPNEVTIQPGRALDHDLVAAYAAVGVDRLLVAPETTGGTEIDDLIAHIGDLISRS